MRTLRHIHDRIVDFCGPLVWSLSMLPDLMLRMVTAACAGLIIVWVFGFGMIATAPLRNHENPVVHIVDIPYAEEID